jgi:sortase B
MEELDKNGVSLELSAAGVAADKMARANGAYEHPSKTEDKDVEKPRRDAGLASLQEESEVTTEEAAETKPKEQDKEDPEASDRKAEEAKKEESEEASEDEKKNAKFVIGDFTFKTFHEYRDAQEDVKKIELINRELDIHDPATAVRLYNMIRAGEIAFKSPIGEQFFDHIADIVADRSVGLLEDRAVIEEADDAVKNQKRIGAAIIGLAVLAFAYFGYSELHTMMETRRMSKLQEQVSAGDSGESYTYEKSDAEDAEESDGDTKKWSDAYVDPSTLTVMDKFATLQEENEDTAGWIKIDDTEIDYPIVQTEDNEYYLSHDFDKNEDSNGTLFVDSRCDLVNPTTNTIIYGHNMKSGLMFGSLKSYLDEDYYNDHKTIHFSTLYEDRTYEIVAVCLSKVAYQDDDSYRYYNFIDAASDSEFQAFYENVQSLSVYGTDVDLSSDDQLLTLSTCNSYVEDGRLFLVAKRVE